MSDGQHGQDQDEFHSSVPCIDRDLLQLGNPLGRGSFGQVFKVLYNGEKYALKMLDCREDCYRKQFLNEIEQLYILRHPNIIKVIGRCNWSITLAFVMELMDDGSMEDMLHRHLRYTYKADHVISWARQCADAVSFIHGKSLVHRDLKPNNLLLKDGFRLLKLCDFGTAGQLRTQMTNNLGSPSWMAPEVFMGQSYNDKCDVYSFGITLWEMVTRKRPFGVELAPYSILWKACAGVRPPVICGECVNVIMDLIVDCWAKDPKSRPSMKDVLEILLELSKIFPNGSDPLVGSEEEPRRNNGSVARSTVAKSESNFLNEIDPALRPVSSTDVQQDGGDIYSEQLAACRKLFDLNNSLEGLLRRKHGLVAKLRDTDEVVRLLTKRKSLRSELTSVRDRLSGMK